MAPVAGMLAVALVVVAAAGPFLRHQALWIDETTQMSGLTLSPLQVVRWLVHPASHDFGVPGIGCPRYPTGWGGRGRVCSG